jgi:hypothetical protein
MNERVMPNRISAIHYKDSTKVQVAVITIFVKKNIKGN